jgi:Uma2 family endonuclease
MNTVLSMPKQEKQVAQCFFKPVIQSDRKKQFENLIYFDHKYTPVSDRIPISDDMDNSPYNGMIVSEKEYWAKYYEMSDVSLEWNNGRLEEKPMPDRESFELYSWLWRLLMEYFDTFEEGMLIGLETGFKLTFDDHTSIRKPDLAFIHRDNPIQMAPFDRTYYGCFDICFEFLSDSDKSAVERDTVVKKHEYEQFGVKEYYILDRLGDETTFYSLDSNGIYQTLKPDKDGVIHSTVLNKFQFREEDLYNRPHMMSLINDNVYRPYVRIEYQKKLEALEKEKLRANKAESRANKAESRANKAESQANKEKLRAEKAESRIKLLEKELAVQRNN